MFQFWQLYFIGSQPWIIRVFHYQMGLECFVCQWVLRSSAGRRERTTRCLSSLHLFSRTTSALKSMVLQLYSTMSSMLVSFLMNSFNCAALHRQKTRAPGQAFIRIDQSVFSHVGHFMKQCAVFCFTFIVSQSLDHSQYLWKGMSSYFLFRNS